ncbi:hypothetical protein VKT23_012876 [Stygiomarasmius scandens]|uniref:Fungal STAND N-terminal Goodbye domain-containing protein n=1 Tax=Marasmiellus scandens TaxID=2682957 RepID=A0ABR1J8J7_9AGAR
MTNPVTLPNTNLNPQETQFVDIWNEAVKKYNDTLAGAKGVKLQEFSTKEEALNFINKEAAGFGKFKEKGEKVMKYVNPILDIIGLLCGTAGEAVGLAFEPSKAIFTGIGMLIQQLKNSSEMYDNVSKMLEKLNAILSRFRIHTEYEIDKELREVYIKSIAQVLNIIGMLVEIVGKGHIRAAMRNTFTGNKKFKAALKELDQNCDMENKMAIALISRDHSELITRYDQYSVEFICEFYRESSWYGSILLLHSD